ncbi:MAG: universal stress protein [Chloroflexota bacterium]|nr:universal stress protein [Chloroflexota bacterium]
MKNRILCPTRGGQASYPNQDAAIELAIERQAEIVFLYITDVHFMDHFASPKLINFETELDEMGDFLLTMAVERAQKSGVEATGIVRRGSFRQTLLDILESEKVNAVILGSSRLETSELTPEFIKDLASELSVHTGIEFIIVDDGEIVVSFKDEVNQSQKGEAEK